MYATSRHRYANTYCSKLDAEHIKRADLILVMSHNQQKHIEQTWPFAKGKTFRLGHWQNKNVPDPYQHDQTVLMRLVSLFKNALMTGKTIFNFRC